MRNYICNMFLDFCNLINCNRRRTTQGGGVAAPVGGKVIGEVLTYLKVEKDNK